mmetsp:Transcript_3387/g.4984  ORF Transcript_3387/g.4984 Transcript_3387/m.4984 type:complete len:165 (-) Transcript_3387:737-1231(-)
MPLSHMPHMLSAPKAQYSSKEQIHAKGMDHVPRTAALVQKVFSAPTALFFSAAINYIANRLGREQQDCSTLPSSSGTVSGPMDMDEGDAIAMLSSSISEKSEGKMEDTVAVGCRIFSFSRHVFITCELQIYFSKKFGPSSSTIFFFGGNVPKAHNSSTISSTMS